VQFWTYTFESACLAIRCGFAVLIFILVLFEFPTLAVIIINLGAKSSILPLIFKILNFF
jgi:hypothetical protein